MLLLLSFAFAQDIVLDESLATSSSATTVYGGTFTGTGWRIDDPDSRLYWDFGAQLERGEVSVVIDGITMDNLIGDNNHLIELFSDGGHFTAQRAINVRLFAGPGEKGDIKLKVWDRAIGGAEERYQGLVWDGSPKLFRVTWDLDRAALYVDGVELMRLDVAGMDLRVATLWLPLIDWLPGAYDAPIGSEYRDLRLAAWEGDGTVDPGDPADDGDPTTHLPMEDVGVASHETGVFGDIADLPVSAGAEQSYLMYDLSAVTGTVTKATLRLFARDVASADGDPGGVYAVSDTSWSEDTLTWAAAPPLGARLATVPAVGVGDVVEVDVTAGVTTGGKVAFGLTNEGGNGAHFSSKEDAGGARAAVLTVITVPDEADTDTDTDADTDTDTDTDADTHADADDTAGDDDTATDSPPPGDLAGCGCGTGGPVPPWAALLGLLALRRRSTRGRRVSR